MKNGLQRQIKVPSYKYIKGCDIDAMFGQALMRNNCGVPIKRMAAGKYMFGTRNIIAKIINMKLVIRVGGGYMSVDEFIQQYGPTEMFKIQKSIETKHPQE